jgi:hypothetical protein
MSINGLYPSATIYFTNRFNGRDILATLTSPLAYVIIAMKIMDSLLIGDEQSTRYNRLQPQYVPHLQINFAYRSGNAIYTQSQDVTALEKTQHKIWPEYDLWLKNPVGPSPAPFSSIMDQRDAIFNMLLDALTNALNEIRSKKLRYDEELDVTTFDLDIVSMSIVVGNI